MLYWLGFDHTAVITADQIRKIFKFMIEIDMSFPTEATQYNWTSRINSIAHWTSRINSIARYRGYYDSNLSMNKSTSYRSSKNILSIRADQSMQYYNFTLNGDEVKLIDAEYYFPDNASFEFKENNMEILGLDDHELTIARIAGLQSYLL